MDAPNHSYPNRIRRKTDQNSKNIFKKSPFSKQTNQKSLFENVPNTDNTNTKAFQELIESYDNTSLLKDESSNKIRPQIEQDIQDVQNPAHSKTNSMQMYIDDLEEFVQNVKNNELQNRKMSQNELSTPIKGVIFKDHGVSNLSKSRLPKSNSDLTGVAYKWKNKNNTTNSTNNQSKITNDIENNSSSDYPLDQHESVSYEGVISNPNQNSKYSSGEGNALTRLELLKNKNTQRISENNNLKNRINQENNEHFDAKDIMNTNSVVNRTSDLENHKESNSSINHSRQNSIKRNTSIEKGNLNVNIPDISFHGEGLLKKPHSAFESHEYGKDLVFGNQNKNQESSGKITLGLNILGQKSILSTFKKDAVPILRKSSESARLHPSSEIENSNISRKNSGSFYAGVNSDTNKGMTGESAWLSWLPINRGNTYNIGDKNDTKKYSEELKGSRRLSNHHDRMSTPTRKNSTSGGFDSLHRNNSEYKKNPFFGDKKLKILTRDTNIQRTISWKGLENGNEDELVIKSAGLMQNSANDDKPKPQITVYPNGNENAYGSSIYDNHFTSALYSDHGGGIAQDDIYIDDSHAPSEYNGSEWALASEGGGYTSVDQNYTNSWNSKGNINEQKTGEKALEIKSWGKWTGLACSPEGKKSAVLAGQEGLVIMEIGSSNIVKSLNLVGDLRGTLNSDFRDVLWPSSSSIITGSSNGTIFLWDPHMGSSSKIKHTINASNRAVSRLAIQPQTPSIFYAAFQDGYVMGYDDRIYGKTSTKQNVTGFKIGQYVANDISFNPANSNHVAIAIANGRVGFWDLRQTKSAYHMILAHATGRTQCVDWHENGKLVASGGSDGIIKIWDISTTEEEKLISVNNSNAKLSISGPKNPFISFSSYSHVKRLSWRPEYPSQIASCSLVSDNLVNVWDTQKLARSTMFHDIHTEIATSLLWFDSDTLWSCGNDGRFVVCDVKKNMHNTGKYLTSGSASVGLYDEVAMAYKSSNDPKPYIIGDTSDQATDMESLKLMAEGKKSIYIDNSKLNRELFYPLLTKSYVQEVTLDSDLGTNCKEITYCAENYSMDSNAIPSAFEHNSKVSLKLERSDLVKTWSYLAFIFRGAGLENLNNKVLHDTLVNGKSYKNTFQIPKDLRKNLINARYSIKEILSEDENTDCELYEALKIQEDKGQKMQKRFNKQEKYISENIFEKNVNHSNIVRKAHVASKVITSKHDSNYGRYFKTKPKNINKKRVLKSIHKNKKSSLLEDIDANWAYSIKDNAKAMSRVYSLEGKLVPTKKMYRFSSLPIASEINSEQHHDPNNTNLPEVSVFEKDCENLFKNTIIGEKHYDQLLPATTSKMTRTKKNKEKSIQLGEIIKNSLRRIKQSVLSDNPDSIPTRHKSYQNFVSKNHHKNIHSYSLERNGGGKVLENKYKETLKTKKHTKNVSKNQKIKMKIGIFPKNSKYLNTKIENKNNLHSSVDIKDENIKHESSSDDLTNKSNTNSKKSFDEELSNEFKDTLKKHIISKNTSHDLNGNMDGVGEYELEIAVKICEFYAEKGCGHGGHSNHIEEWFTNNKTCPSGCGHKCTT
ncbi:hypothetical protein BB559_004245 [Furculomyces boomerangus]|uniref:Uncharacterized protein n=2 Tax=Furculomyces boomerangus TaxID=61424 RepID=A0A2T9YFW4_9FUNG|nr:hypothetical protein BB559_004245 [Furculomyces boomerangus]